MLHGGKRNKVHAQETEDYAKQYGYRVKAAGLCIIHFFIWLLEKYWKLMTNIKVLQSNFTKASGGSTWWKCSHDPPKREQIFTLYGPPQANLVFIAYVSSEGSGEPAHLRSLARTSAARSYKQWVKRNLQTESQIPSPSEWLGMRS